MNNMLTSALFSMTNFAPCHLILPHALFLNVLSRLQRLLV